MFILPGLSDEQAVDAAADGIASTAADSRSTMADGHHGPHHCSATNTQRASMLSSCLLTS